MLRDVLALPYTMVAATVLARQLGQRGTQDEY
jgi:hypothetical protein